MNSLRRLLRRRAERRAEVAREVNEEIDFHLAMREARLRREGVQPHEAGIRARKRFGDVNRIRERLVRDETRQLRRRSAWLMVEEAVSDARFAVRVLLRSRGFALAVVVTLALGIGANMLILSVIRGVLLRPVSGIPDAASVLEFTGGVSYPAFQDIAERLPRMPIAALSERPMAVGLGPGADRVVGAVVSGNFFEVMSVRAALGRPLDPRDDVAGTAPVAVLDHDYWRSAAGGDSSIVGRSIHVNGVAVAVVGVAAPDFHGFRLGEEPAVWLTVNAWPVVAPAGRARIHDRGWEWLRLSGRLQPGQTLEDAQRVLRRAIAGAYPDLGASELTALSAPRRLQTAALSSRSRDGIVRFMSVVAGVVVLVLLAACANVAGLLIARAASREREIGVRIALGAGRRRLVRQLVTESLVLAGAGGLAGVGLFAAGRSVLTHITFPGGLAGSAIDLSLDAGLLGFAAALTLLTGMLIGLAPALQSSRPEIVSALKGAGARRGTRQHWLRGALVTAQVAIAIVLLFGMGLFARALTRALAIDLGYDPAPLAAIAMDPAMARVDGAERMAYFGTVAERASEVPGVAAVTWTNFLPLTAAYDRQTADIPGYVPGPDERVAFEFSSVGPRFHEVMGIPLVSGRGFDERDAGDTTPVAIVNQTAAARYFAGRDPIGARFVMGGTDLRIVGVARDIRHHELDEEPRPHAWFPLLQAVARGGGSSPVLIVRAHAEAARVLPEVVEAARSADPRVPVFASITMTDHLRDRLAPQLAGAWLLGIFGALGLVVAAVGIHGIVAYAVSMRTREIGLRMALGAHPGHVLRLVVARNLAFAAAGIPIGLICALALSRMLRSFLYGVPPHDLVTLAGSGALMLAIAAVASSLPARRATRIDPLVALRSDA